MNGAQQRRRTALWNAAFGYATLASTLARNIALVPLYLKFMALGEYGAWLATGGALVQLLVTDLGLSGVVTQRIALLSGARDPSGIRAVVAAGLVNATMLAGLLTVLGAVLGAFLPATQGLVPAEVERVARCFVLAIVASGLGVVGATTTAALRGLQRAVAAGAITLVADVASIAATVACLFADFGLYSLALPLLLRSAITLIGGLVALRAALTPAAVVRPRFDWRDSVELWRQCSRFFLTSIAMRLQSQANTLAVGAFLGPQVAATYGLTVRAHETVLIVLWQLNAALGPVLAHLVGAGERSRFDHVVRRLLPFVAAVAAVGAGGVVLLDQTFVTLWVGPHGFAGFATTLCMGIALWVMALASLGYEALVARGEFSFITRVYLGASLVHVTLLFALVHSGPWAAPFALCVSTGAWGVIFWRRVLADMGCTRGEAVRIAAEPLRIAALVALAVGALGWLLPHAAGWPAFLMQAATVGGLLAGLLLAARPGLREMLRSEFGSTWRALRAA